MGSDSLNDGVVTEADFVLPWRGDTRFKPRRGSKKLVANTLVDRVFFSSSALTMSVLLLPAIAFLGYRIIISNSVRWESVLWSFLGPFSWLLTEYLLHRFFFHFPWRGKVGLAMGYFVHGHHHVYPFDRRKIAATFWQFGLVAVPFATLAYQRMNTGNADALILGFLLTYILYEWLHRGFHLGRPLANPILRRLQRRHLKHHFLTPRKNFGISSPLLDVAFGSRDEPGNVGLHKFAAQQSKSRQTGHK